MKAPKEKTRNPRVPTAMQLARYGHIALALDNWLKQRNMHPADLNLALGRPRVHPSVYTWIRGLGAPEENNRKLLAKVTGIPEDQLCRRELETPETVKQGALVITSERVVAKFDLSEVVRYVELKNGTARIRFDVELPRQQGRALMNHLWAASDLMLSAEDERE